MTDLSQYEQRNLADEGVWMEVEDPSGNPLGIHILLAGNDSQAYQKELRKHQDKMLKKNKMKISAEEAENQNLNLLSACTLNWQGVEYQGVELECNRENIRWLYKNFPFIREQADDFIGDRANFLGE